MTSVSENLALVLQKIAAACQKHGRDPAGVRLVAVSKTHGLEAVQQALDAGQRVFGENRVQEAEAKFSVLKQRTKDIELHLIGPLQTNKVAQAVALFDVIQTLDRPKLAQALAKECARQKRFPRLYIEINTGAEPQKAGVAPQALGSLLSECIGLGLKIDGLMCIPPFDQDPVPHFMLLADLAQEHGLACLSMGMSADFDAAIASGATEVRIGTAIFGERGWLSG